MRFVQVLVFAREDYTVSPEILTFDVAVQSRPQQVSLTHVHAWQLSGCSDLPEDVYPRATKLLTRPNLWKQGAGKYEPLAGPV